MPHTNRNITALNHFRLLGNSGLRVSPLCLGAMTFGKEWNWGADKDESRRMFDLYLDKGGNFIDTANRYTESTSETYIGEFMEGRREQIVLATKFTLSMRFGDPNAAGNHRKNLVQSLEASLKRLKTDYIDLYWVHAWDQVTPIEETMRALDDAVKAGKVLYVGISDMPAWKVAQANTIAYFRGWSPFIAIQIKYSLIDRTVERELIPMAMDLGLGVTPWAPLGAGFLTGKYNPMNSTEPPDTIDSGGRRSIPDLLKNDRIRDISLKVQQIAAEIGRSPAQVALNWLLQKTGVTSPIIGARTVKQLEDNLGSLDFNLPQESENQLDEVSAIELGFPHDFLAADYIVKLVTSEAVIEK